MLERPERNLFTGAAVRVIRVYKLIISPWLPRACRFEPTCSAYAELAVQRFGFLRGSWLALKRLLRCRPFGPYGYDPVPEKSERHL